MAIINIVPEIHFLCSVSGVKLLRNVYLVIISTSFHECYVRGMGTRAYNEEILVNEKRVARKRGASSRRGVYTKVEIGMAFVTHLLNGRYLLDKRYDGVTYVKNFAWSMTNPSDPDGVTAAAIEFGMGRIVEFITEALEHTTVSDEPLPKGADFVHIVDTERGPVIFIHRFPKGGSKEWEVRRRDPADSPLWFDEAK